MYRTVNFYVFLIIVVLWRTHLFLIHQTDYEMWFQFTSRITTCCCFGNKFQQIVIMFSFNPYQLIFDCVYVPFVSDLEIDGVNQKSNICEFWGGHKNFALNINLPAKIIQSIVTEYFDYAEEALYSKTCDYHNHKLDEKILLKLYRVRINVINWTIWWNEVHDEIS